MHQGNRFSAGNAHNAGSFIGLALSAVLLVLGLIFVAQVAGFGPSHETQPCGIIRGARGEARNTCE